MTLFVAAVIGSSSKRGGSAGGTFGVGGRGRSCSTPIVGTIMGGVAAR